MDKVQAHLLRVFRPLARLPAESEVGLDAQVAGLEEKLRTDKVPPAQPPNLFQTVCETVAEQ